MYMYIQICTFKYVLDYSIFKYYICIYIYIHNITLYYLRKSRAYRKIKRIYQQARNKKNTLYITRQQTTPPLSRERRGGNANAHKTAMAKKTHFA